MRLILLGVPGAGKGSLAERLVHILKLPHISTGRIFRTAIAAGSQLGKRVKSIIDEGHLVDDETTIQLVKERLDQEDARNGYILDGFPRTVFQAEALCEFSPVDKVIDLDIPDEMVVERLGGRRVCRKCGHNYHMVSDKPRKEGICYRCGGEVYIRDDDKYESVIERLVVYREQTAPLIEYYQKKGLLVIIDAQPTVDQVLENFKTALDL